MSGFGRVVVGVPTYRRPDGLARLLESLRPEVGDRAFVVIADNACDPGTAEIADRALPDVEHRVVDVPAKGVSQARNALLDCAYREVPEWEWMVMLDDDGWVTPGWFEALLSAGVAYDADIVGGTVDHMLGAHPSLLVRNSPFAQRPRHATGPVTGLSGTQNVALRRRLVDALDRPWFDPALGGLGGEDHDFFVRSRQADAQLIWCDEAEVVEPTPADRLTLHGIRHRAFHTGVVNSYISLKHHDPGAVRREIARLSPFVVRGFLSGVARRDPNRLARVAVDAISLTGRCYGYLSARRSFSGTTAHAAPRYGRTWHGR